jgi:membrane fusion protein (multidrug efflux system)
MRAPFDGVITSRLAEPGDVLARFKQVLTLTNPESLVTELSISELLLPTLSIDDSVKVTIDALPGREYSGKISRIHPTVDPATRLGKVEIILKPAPQGVLPGQLCRVTLSGRPIPRLLIPFNALQRDAQGEYIFIVDSVNNAVKKRIQSGSHFGERVEIISGIEEGQRVVTKGYYDLPSGAAVEIVGQVSGAQTAQ